MMKVEVDTTKLEEAMISNLQQGDPNEVILREMFGPKTFTRQEIINDVRNETPAGREMVEALAQSSIRIWLLRQFQDN